MPHIIFTEDSHEFTRGKLAPGKPCRINFDASRFAAKAPGYIQGHPAYSIKVFGEFLPGHQKIDLTLISETGIQLAPVENLTGTGSMLSGDIAIPAGTAEIVLWVALYDPQGNVYYDSNDGKNYHFRMVNNDITEKNVTVTKPADAPVGELDVAFTTIADVSAIQFNYRIINNRDDGQEKQLPLTATEKDGLTQWSVQAPIPAGAELVYDFEYLVGNNKFKEDNDGKYYSPETALTS
ncbi:MAG: DUF6209 family protein [Bacteroidota bacterium]